MDHSIWVYARRILLSEVPMSIKIMELVEVWGLPGA